MFEHAPKPFLTSDLSEWFGVFGCDLLFSALGDHLVPSEFLSQEFDLQLHELDLGTAPCGEVFGKHDEQEGNTPRNHRLDSKKESCKSSISKSPTIWTLAYQPQNTPQTPDRSASLQKS